MSTMKYSVILLLEEPHDDFHLFVQSLYDLFLEKGEPFEFLIVANGIGWFLRDQLQRLGRCFEFLKVFELNAKTTQAVCLNVGLKESRGEIIVVCGSYQQIKNESLMNLLDAMDDTVDIISPWRRCRRDPSFNQLQSRVFNALVSRMTHSDLHDLSCTVKVFRREVLEGVRLYGNMYRFLPILAMRKGFKNKELECEHHDERGPTGFYNVSEYLNRIIDIFTLYFNTRFTRKPLRFFSALGLVFLVLGLLITFLLFMQKLLFGYPIGDRSILLVAIFFIVLGVQAAGVGLVGEIIVFTRRGQVKEFTIEKILSETREKPKAMQGKSVVP